MAEFVANSRKKARRSNTAVACDPKRDEFEHFCALNFKPGHSQCIVDEDKTYKFMFHKSFREKKKCGGGKKNKPPPFDQDNHIKICGPLLKDTGLACEQLPQPVDPIQWSQFNTHRAAVKNPHEEQRSKKCNSQPWDLVWTVQCKTLERHVKERVLEIKKATFAEKTDGEMAPHIMAEKFPEIEEEMWKDSKQARGSRNVCSMLRRRSCMLHLTSGVLRSESAHANEISDFFGLRPPQKELDVHRMFLMTNQIAEGKTCHGDKQWGRATRRKNVKLCCPGGAAVHLGHRLLQTGEFADVTVEQWMDDSHWCGIEFLIDTGGSDNTVEMSSGAHGDHIDKALIPSDSQTVIGESSLLMWLAKERFRARHKKSISLFISWNFNRKSNASAGLEPLVTIEPLFLSFEGSKAVKQGNVINHHGCNLIQFVSKKVADRWMDRLNDFKAFGLPRKEQEGSRLKY